MGKNRTKSKRRPEFIEGDGANPWSDLIENRELRIENYQNENELNSPNPFPLSPVAFRQILLLGLPGGGGEDGSGDS